MVCSAAAMLSIDVIPLDDADALPVPREAARGAAHWPRSVWASSDAFALAREARRLCSVKLKQARPTLTENCCLRLCGLPHASCQEPN